MANELTQEYVSECFTYDKDTGHLFWKSRPLNHFTSHARAKCWNKRYAKTRAGAYQETVSKIPYYGITINGHFMKMHRVVWPLIKGEWPNGYIDHINGDSTDNRIANLRDVPASLNSKNMRVSARNTSGVPGVTMNKRINRWKVRLTANNSERITLGQFKDFFEAVCTRKSAENKHGYHLNNGRSKV